MNDIKNNFNEEETKRKAILAERIDHLMRLNKLTNKALSELLCVGVSTVSGYRTAYRMPNPMVLCHLCSIFNVTPDYLLGYSDSYNHDLDDTQK